MDVKIMVCDAVKVAVLEHQGPPSRLNESVEKFIRWRKESRLSPIKTSMTLGVAYDNPDTTEPAQFRFDICGSVSADVPINSYGVKTKIIPGGRCAVVRHLGSRDRIGETAYFLYGEWLPNSGEELRDFPLYFHYLNLFPETAEADLITDVFLPLATPDRALV